MVVLSAEPFGPDAMVQISRSAHYHAVVRKSELTELALAELRRQAPAYLCEARELALFKLGGWIVNVQRWVDFFEHSGLRRGADFVVAGGPEGGVDPMPSWLKVELGPTGNPAELEARMTPEVREMWEQTRLLTYSLRRDA